ncbi:leucyl aminopeptidase, partial [Streptomyces sp. SID10244]|nr:leucyl aminopeptidase [Streptomyces sp. SID10244]
IGLIKPENSDKEGGGTDAEPTLVIGDGIFDDAQAEFVGAAARRLGASGSHGEITRLPAPAGLDVDIIVAVGLGTTDNLDDPEQIRQAAGIAAREL